MYSPIIPIKNSCTPPKKNKATMIVMMPGSAILRYRINPKTKLMMAYPMLSTERKKPTINPNRNGADVNDTRPLIA